MNATLVFSFKINQLQERKKKSYENPQTIHDDMWHENYLTKCFPHQWFLTQSTYTNNLYATEPYRVIFFTSSCCCSISSIKVLCVTNRYVYKKRGEHQISDNIGTIRTQRERTKKKLSQTRVPYHFRITYTFHTDNANAQTNFTNNFCELNHCNGFSSCEWDHFYSSFFSHRFCIVFFFFLAFFLSFSIHKEFNLTFNKLNISFHNFISIVTINQRVVYISFALHEEKKKFRYTANIKMNRKSSVQKEKKRNEKKC